MKYQKGDFVVTNSDCGIITKASPVSTSADLERMIFEVRFQTRPENKYIFIWSNTSTNGPYLWSINADADASNVKKIIRGNKTLWER